MTSPTVPAREAVREKLQNEIADLEKVLSLREDGLLGPDPEHRAIIRARIGKLRQELAHAKEPPHAD